MLTKIKHFFFSEIQSTQGSTKDSETIAALALLIEVIEADSHYSDDEKTTLHKIVKDSYPEHGDNIEEIITLVREEIQSATDLFQFTSMINASFSKTQKQALVQQLWEIAYADGILDKYEDYIIRKICDLLYISHSDMIRARNIAAQKP